MHKKKILIVEDAEYMREMLGEILDQRKYEIVGTAVNGLEAIKKYEELKPDLVTMDLMMEKMDGIKAIKEIKKRDPNAIILVISALGAKEYVDAAMEAGASEYIWKPFMIKSLSNMLEKVFEKIRK